MLSIRNVTKTFGGVAAVADMSFEVAASEIHGLIGPNGAGKTTMINLISGFLTPNSGRILLDDTEIHRMPPEQRARAGIARTFQNLRLFRNLSVRRNIEVAESNVGAGADRSLVEEAIDRFGLRGVMEQTPDSLSYGHMRRLEIIRALALRPRVLMLDEPAAGMNAEETEELFENLEWLRARHACAIILIDHDLKFVLQASDTITVMNMGSLLASGLPRDVTANKEVVRAYLGTGQN
ncbi:branched-chain amino acid ABC transporter, ATP-binding protein [Oceanicola granulosus HTCC2516]|uniref:Branched-chain amino acid ABC transporter, ATP-binding protein n=1 Tax=Oceanicola granulosus (strain ATCC BAA-861 / DSM 15982 / KCTC 12143 / HTCC2516) TaxID=314256 RepID=Q2CEU4_OCEGH|nr:ABC transporter ATP-binding protein [Oceanicola granulosus]EAR51164.1 branched-chain amino acid ABC transporter, ATP-binding protein [Oceanicola granulosus HTCC2516]